MRTREEAEGKRLHVYGVVRATSRLPMDLHGRQGAPVRRVRHGPIGLLVSELDPSKRLTRQDLVAHAHVLERIADRQSVLPMRFGVEADSEAALLHHVVDADEWGTRLHRFDGLVQVSIDAMHREEAAIREVARRDPAISQLKQRLGPADDGRDRPVRLELGERVSHGLEGLRREDAAALMRWLQPFAREVVDRTQEGQLLQAAFLVERRRREEFDAAVAAAREELPRIDIRYVGPQPPWAFLEHAPEGEGAWAS